MRNIYYKVSFVLVESLVSSAVERQPFKLVVEGSIPSWGENFFFNIENYLLLLEI